MSGRWVAAWASVLLLQVLLAFLVLGIAGAPR